MITRIFAATIPRHMVIYPLFINYCGAAGITIASYPGCTGGYQYFAPMGLETCTRIDSIAQVNVGIFDTEGDTQC